MLYLDFKPLLECLANTSDKDNRRMLTAQPVNVPVNNLFAPIIYSSIDSIALAGAFILRVKFINNIPSTPVTHNSLLREDDDLSAVADKAVKKQTVWTRY